MQVEQRLFMWTLLLTHPFLFHQLARQPCLSCVDLQQPKVTISSLCGSFSPEGGAVISSNSSVVCVSVCSAQFYN